MANIQLKIRTLADNDTEINSIKNTGNNVTNGSVKLANSEGFFATIPMADFAGQELLTFAGGALQFTSNGMLANGSGNVGRLVDESDGKEFIWGVVPESKKYFVEVQLSVSNLDLTAITLYGDSVAQQYPTEVIVNGQTYQNDDVVLTIPVNTNSTQINVKMTKWKRANYNACLTKIAIFAGEIQLENRDIKSLESLSQSTGQPESIFYGCVPSSGSASINDRKGEFYDYIKNGVISNSNSVIDLFVNGKKVQTHIATDSDYDTNGKIFSLDLENQLSLYDNVVYDGYSYKGVGQTLYNIFVEFATTVGISVEKISKMLSTQIRYGNYKTGTVADYFKSIFISYPYIESGTVRKTLDKFCTIAQLNLVNDDEGDLIFVQARPVKAGNQQVLVIPAKNQMSAIERNIIVKNKIEQATVETTLPQETIETNVVVANKVITTTEEDIDESSRTWRQASATTTIDYQSKYLALYTGVGGISYYNVTVRFPKYNGKSYITSVEQDQTKKVVRCKMTYTKESGDVSYNSKIAGLVNGIPVVDSPLLSFNKDPNIGKIKFTPMYTETIVDNIISTDSVMKSEIQNTPVNIVLYNAYYSGVGGYQVENKIDITNKSILPYMTYNETDNEYVVNILLMASKTTVVMSTAVSPNLLVGDAVEFKGVYSPAETDLGLDRYQSHIGNCVIYHAREGYEQYIPQQLEVFFNGNRIVVNFDETNFVTTSNSNYANNSDVSISGNELLTNATSFISSTISGATTSQPLAEIIANNIVSDYKNGVSTCRVTVTCGDYADEYGVVRKHWAKGEIFQVGDIVRLDKDNDGTPAVTYKDGSTMLWKITGRNFRHEGVPLLDLELQEIF